MGASEIAFNMPFWSFEEIEAGLKIRNEWEIEDSLVPFLGDWHELLCLNLASEEVVFINDARKPLFSWPSTDEFMRSLIKEFSEEPSSIAPPKLIRSEMTEDLRKRIQARLNQGPA